LPVASAKQTIVVDGQSQSATGVACQNSDGTWSLQNGNGGGSNGGGGDSDQ